MHFVLREVYVLCDSGFPLEGKSYFCDLDHKIDHLLRFVDLKLKNHIIAELEKENEELKKRVNKLKDDATFYHTQWGKEIDLCKDLERELEYTKRRKWWMIWSL